RYVSTSSRSSCTSSDQGESPWIKKGWPLASTRYPSPIRRGKRVVAARGSTSTVTAPRTVPPAPWQARSKFDVAISGAVVSVPLAGREPAQAPDAEHASAPVEFQVSVTGL